MECKTTSGSQMKRAPLSHTHFYVHSGFTTQMELQSWTRVLAGQICTLGALAHMPDSNTTSLPGLAPNPHTMLKITTCNFFCFSTLYWMGRGDSNAGTSTSTSGEGKAARFFQTLVVNLIQLVQLHKCPKDLCPRLWTTPL